MKAEKESLALEPSRLQSPPTPLQRLREYFKPEGPLEELLVEKLATIIWRRRRLLSAEGGEIQRARKSPRRARIRPNWQDPG